MSNEANIKELEKQYYALTAKLRDYGNDYAMENGGLTSALYLAADIIELLLP
jgi:hypothetical protein